MMKMSMMRIMKTEVGWMMNYWGRLGCFVKSALNTKELSKGWRWIWDCLRLGSIIIGMVRRIILLTQFWLLLRNICFHPHYDFLKDWWMEYDNGPESLSLFVQGKVKIPEGADYKDQWERVICPTIHTKYVTISCNLNNEIWKTYKSKMQMRTKFFWYY